MTRAMDIRDRINRLRELEVALFNRQSAEQSRIYLKQSELYRIQSLLEAITRNPLSVVYFRQVYGMTMDYDQLVRRRQELIREIEKERQIINQLAEERKRIADEIYRLSQMLVPEMALIQPTPIEKQIEANRLVQELIHLQEEARLAQSPFRERLLVRIEQIRRRLRELGYQY